jgi:hypothetical protein
MAAQVSQTARSAPRKPAASVAVRQGQVQGLMRANGGWMAVVAAFTAGPADPVISQVVPIDTLRGPARRKADRWARELA